MGDKSLKGGGVEPRGELVAYLECRVGKGLGAVVGAPLVCIYSRCGLLLRTFIHDALVAHHSLPDLHFPVTPGHVRVSALGKFATVHILLGSQDSRRRVTWGTNDSCNLAPSPKLRDYFLMCNPLQYLNPPHLQSSSSIYS